jgi:hypothetical protein
VFPSLIDFDLSDVLERLDVPTLIVVGDKDRLTPLRGAQHMAERIAGARLLVLTDAGHSAFLEEHEALNQAITEFAEEVLGRPVRRRLRRPPASGRPRLRAVSPDDAGPPPGRRSRRR